MTIGELYSELEDNNDHGLTAMLVAVACQDYKAVIRLGQIIDQHHKEGSMTAAMCAERYKISQPLYRTLVENGALA